MDMFSQRINNALFRHQTLIGWRSRGQICDFMAADGKPSGALAAYARGVADNDSQLSAIYRASLVSLHASPHGGRASALYGRPGLRGVLS